MDRVEAAGGPALVLNKIPSRRAEAFRAQRQRHVPTQIEMSVTRGWLAQQMRVERMARPGCACRRGRRPLSQIRANSRRPTAPMGREGVHNPWSHRLGPTGLQAIY